MNIVLSEFSGYCYGVKRAVDMAERSIEKYGTIYSLGPIIHNKKAIQELEKKGLETVDALKSNFQTCLFRSHGAEEKDYDFAKKNSIVIVDTTCIFVKKIHKIVKEKYRQGKEIIIVGNKKHPEVVGINSWCAYTAKFVETKEDVEKLDIKKEKEYVVVFQTTFNMDKYEEMVSTLSLKIKNVEIFNTVCNATKKRQDSATALAKKVDFMVVIGDRQSSNSKKLYEITRKYCKSIFIEEKTELENSLFSGIENVGITAGASTPAFVINEVIEYIKDLEKNSEFM